MEHKYLDRDFYWVIEEGNEKFIHPYGIGSRLYETEEENNEDFQCMFVYYRDCYVNIKQLADCDDFPVYGIMLKRAKEFDFMKEKDMFEMFDNGIFNEKPIELRLTKVTKDTPCGWYVDYESAL